jgi:hypothetical protein
VSDGVPVTLVHHALRHEQASTTLDRYTYAASGHGDRLGAVFADSSLASGEEVVWGDGAGSPPHGALDLAFHESAGGDSG